MSDKLKCKIDGCLNGGRLRRGWCTVHYKRWWSTGDTQADVPQSPRTARPGDAQRFYQETALAFNGDDCLIWPYKKSKGYAVLGGKIVSRMACEATYGQPPTLKHQAAHSCGNGVCVNPLHLSWKTRSENELDKHKHGTALRGERARGAKLNTADVLMVKELQGKKTPSEIARMFGVKASSIRNIHTGRSWAWL